MMVADGANHPEEPGRPRAAVSPFITTCVVPPTWATMHDDLEQVFAAPLGRLLHAHVVDDREIGPQRVPVAFRG